jgi:hypothetical protein
MPGLMDYQPFYGSGRYGQALIGQDVTRFFRIAGKLIQDRVTVQRGVALI